MFKENDLIMLIDNKGRKYIFKLKEGGKFSSHLGFIDHKDIIGREEADVIKTNLGYEYLLLRPLYKDYILKMGRGAQVIYPKDIATILVWADIFPGARVMEAGTGSGALTIALLRAIGEKGFLFSYEIRQDFLKKAFININNFLGEPHNLKLECKDIYSGIDEKDLDRIVLDLPEPWKVIPHTGKSLKDGGVLTALLPTISQVENYVEELEGSNFYHNIEIYESLIRYWKIKKKSSRPEHFMVGHTAFIITARKTMLSSSIRINEVEHWKRGF